MAIKSKQHLNARIYSQLTKCVFIVSTDGFTYTFLQVSSASRAQTKNIPVFLTSTGVLPMQF